MGTTTSVCVCVGFPTLFVTKSIQFYDFGHARVNAYVRLSVAVVSFQSSNSTWPNQHSDRKGDVNESKEKTEIKFRLAAKLWFPNDWRTSHIRVILDKFISCSAAVSGSNYMLSPNYYEFTFLIEAYKFGSIVPTATGIAWTKSLCFVLSYSSVVHSQKG